MAVALSSLRVNAEMDSSNYVRGAKAVVDANRDVETSERSRNAAMAQANAAMDRTIPGFNSLAKNLLQGYGPAQQFEQQIRKIGNAVDQGLGLDRAAMLIEGAYKRFNLIADAATLAKQGFVSIAPAIEAANAKLAVHNEVMQRAAAQTQALAAAQRAQAQINAVTGVSGVSAIGDRGADIQAYAKSLDDLRAKFNPLFAAGRTYRDELSAINTAAKVGAISEVERATAVTRTKAAFVQQVGVLKSTSAASTEAAAAAGLTAQEFRNLGFQVNDVLTGLASGQSPFMIASQQLGQIQQILSGGAGGVSGSLKSIGNYLSSLFTVGRVAFGGLAAVIGVGTLALNSFLGAQQKVAMALTGAGRASGASLGSIGDIAKQAASTVGLSISEARELGSALAATGKIANDNILPIVQMGKDIQHAFGIDATEATKMLADAFSDPAKGADQLNQRLGFLDAGMRRNIENLVAQNRTFEAQKALMEGVKSGLQGVDEAVSGSTKLWTALANGVSNAWDRFGEFIARGLGGVETIQEKIARVRRELDALKSSTGTGGVIIPGGDVDYSGAADNTQAIVDKTAELDKLTTAYQKVASQAAVAQAAQKSFLQEATVRSVQPEIAELEKLANSLRVLESVMGELQNSEAAGETLKRLGVTMEQLSQATRIYGDRIKAFKTDFEQTVSQLNTANQAITAFSPSQKGSVAYQQSMDSSLKSNLTLTERQTQADMASANAIKQATTALSEQARVRELTAKQSTESAALEVQLIGKSIGEQERLKANLQARQQLEQEASQNRTAFDSAQMARLEKQNAAMAQQKQLAAERAAQDKANFDLQTVFMSPADLAAANVMRNLYSDEFQAHMDDALAKQIRLNEAIRDAKDTGQQFASTFVQGLMSGKSAMESLSNAAQQLSSKLADKAITSLFSGDFASAAIQGAAAIAAAVFAKETAADKELDEAQKRWQVMSSDVRPFNLAEADEEQPANDNEGKSQDEFREHSAAA